MEKSGNKPVWVPGFFCGGAWCGLGRGNEILKFLVVGRRGIRYNRKEDWREWQAGIVKLWIGGWNARV